MTLIRKLITLWLVFWSNDRNKASCNNYDSVTSENKSTTIGNLTINDEDLEIYRMACIGSLELYKCQKVFIDSIKQKYFVQLTKNGTELKTFYDLIFRCEDVVEMEMKYIANHLDVDRSNFTGWTEPLEKLQIVKQLHNWKELIRCIDDQKGKNPSEIMNLIRKEALEAFEELSLKFNDVDSLMHKIRKKKKQ